MVLILFPKKIVGSKLNESIEKNIFASSVLIFILAAFFIYPPVVSKIFDKISNFEFKSEYLVAFVLAIVGSAIFLFISNIFGVITAKITSKFISPPAENDNSIKNIIRTILFGYAFKFVGIFLIIIICITLIIFVI